MIPYGFKEATLYGNNRFSEFIHLTFYSFSGVFQFHIFISKLQWHCKEWFLKEAITGHIITDSNSVVVWHKFDHDSNKQGGLFF